MKYLFILTLIIIGCQNSVDQYLVYHDAIIEFDEPKAIHVNRHDWQTIYMLRGQISNVENPEGYRFEWRSNLFWELGDTLGYILRRGLTDELEYKVWDTVYVRGFEGEIVPTINPASYSNSRGEVAIQLAPVRSMIGDTLRVWYDVWWDREFIHSDSLAIVLE